MVKQSNKPEWRRTPRSVAMAVAGAALVSVAALGVGSSTAADIKTVVKTSAAANKDGASYQKRVDSLHDSTQSLAGEYEAVLQQIEALSAYNAQLATLVGSQQAELDSLADQLGRVTVVSRALTPLMLHMIEALESFVQLDVPFLLDERTKRVAKLKNVMNQSDVSESEKFRQIVEAYQIETDYGRTIESYKAEVELSGAEQTVEFLRIGRVALLFQSLDGEVIGHWDPTNKSFQALDDSHKPSLRYGLRVARKQRAPDDLLTIPLIAASSEQE